MGTMHERLTRWGRYVGEIIAPHRCVACFRLTSTIDPYLCLCAPCTSMLNKNIRTMRTWRTRTSNGVMVYGALPYHLPTVRLLIGALKFQGVRSAAQPLADILSRVYATPPHTTANQRLRIIPIPLHRYRERRRGYNQASVLSEQLAERTTGVVVENALVRTRATSPQTEQSKARRHENVRHCFAANPTNALCSEDRVLLIDDVYTTGATFSAAVTALRTIHTGELYGLVAAHGGD